VAQHIRLLGQDQEGSGAACNVLFVQISCCVPVQRETQTEEEAHGKSSSTHCNMYQPPKA